MYRQYKENKYILRRYIRVLSVAQMNKSSHLADVEQAIKFFVILHNLLGLEDMFYDQVMMKDKELNKYLHLQYRFRELDIIGSFYNLYNKGSRIRTNLEGIDRVEEIRIILKADDTLFKKLKV